MGVIHLFDNCPVCNRRANGHQLDMCDKCHTEKIGWRVSSNSLEFRVERLWVRTVGWWIFKRTLKDWAPVDHQGNFIDGEDIYGPDVEYYETIEDAKTALQKFIEPKSPEPPIITRDSEWVPV